MTGGFGMKRIGILFGNEDSFPGALVEQINTRALNGIEAEFIQLGAPSAELAAHGPRYAAVIDRIAHRVPFYSAWLKQLALAGTAVLNDPLRQSSNDKFFEFSLASRLGLAVPPTVMLPHKERPNSLGGEALRNFEYPLDWDAVFATVGEHGFLKPIRGNGGADVYEVHNREEFFTAYDRTRDLCMIYQQAIEAEFTFRCDVVGEKGVRVFAWDATTGKALDALPKLPKAALKRMESEALLFSRTLGYAINRVEFALVEATPFVIDIDPAPEADPQSVGEEHFRWLVDSVADLAIAKAQAAPQPFAFSVALPEDLPIRQKKSATKAVASSRKQIA
jgi:hypothetical protein